jgi:hypothetical protein
MHKEVLTEKQNNLLYLLELFSKNFGLVGGTSIALHLGHRYSIDFDLFSNREFDNLKVRNIIVKAKNKIDKVIRNEQGDYTIIIKGVRFTFFYYPFKIKYSEKLEKIIKLPNLLTLASMKAYALGRRAKWKDYVDLYFIMENYHSIKEITKNSFKIFGDEFNEKLFRTELAYFKDIDFSERVNYLKGFEVPENIIKKELIKFSLEK